MIEFAHRFVQYYVTFARQIDVTAFWFLIILFSVVALCAAWTFFHHARLRIAASIPFLPIDNTRPGYIDLTGHARTSASEPLVTPLTKTPCSWYRYKVWEYDPVDAKFKLLRYDGGMYRLLEMKDETGHCMVNLAGAEVEPSQHRWFYADVMDASLEQMTQHYRQQRYCFEEEYIDQGAQLWISGSCHHVNPELDVRVDANESRLVARVTDEFGVDWVDDVLVDRWTTHVQQSQNPLMPQWQHYLKHLAPNLRPILVSDEELVADQAFVVSTSQPTIHRGKFLLMYWLSGLFTTGCLLVIASMLFLRLL